MNKNLWRGVAASLALILTIPLSLIAWGNRHVWIERNFREVVAGQVYAGGYQEPGSLERILKRHRIRTVLSLLEQGDTGDRIEQATVAAHGVKFLRVPIPFTDSAGEKFSDTEESIEAKLESVEQAVAILADPTSHPVFVHCRGGRHRAGAVIAVYRVRHCGWKQRNAQAELVKFGGLKFATVWPTLVLHEYCARHKSAEETTPNAVRAELPASPASGWDSVPKP